MISLFLFLTFGFLVIAQEKKVKTMTLHEFMENHVDLAEQKFKKGNKEQLIKFVKLMPELSPGQDKAEWKKIVDDHISSDQILKSCKACHIKFKKEYKDTYKKRLVEIPEDIL
jgi:hypothetical protein